MAWAQILPNAWLKSQFIPSFKVNQRMHKRHSFVTQNCLLYFFVNLVKCLLTKSWQMPDLIINWRCFPSQEGEVWMWEVGSLLQGHLPMSTVQGLLSCPGILTHRAIRQWMGLRSQSPGSKIKPGICLGAVKATWAAWDVEVPFSAPTSHLFQISTNTHCVKASTWLPILSSI